MFALVASLLFISPISVYGVCPFMEYGTPPSNNATVPNTTCYNSTVKTLDIAAVFYDLYDLLTTSQPCWPADEFNGEANYGPLMIRLAWHCAGTYRQTDDVGGCGGGRQRFLPESAWDDNVNLDKARALLYPIKEKYGDALSWGDLFIFAGTAAIIQMGGPATKICAGRVDSSDGTLSLPLGPGPEAPECEVQGNCTEPLGADTIGLIYVNPEGIMGNPDPTASAQRIRNVFGRMGMNDTETVALIGGGHAFGKSHGACPDGPGLSPLNDSSNPWPGNCGTGMGNDTYTSGIEGQWTTNPLRWDNEYFTQLLQDNYTLHQGPGNKWQFRNNRTGYLMLVTDIAFMEDDIYRGIVRTFAEDIGALNASFAAAWEKLVTSGENPWAESRHCIDAAALTQAIGNVTTTSSGGGEEAKEGMSDTETTWFIVGIVFIVLFAISLIIIAYLMYKMGSSSKKVSDGKGKYKKSNNPDTLVAEESDHD